MAWIVAHSAAGRLYRSRVGVTGEYSLAGLLPGVYTLFAFADLDGNDEQGPGQLDPWLAAEPYARFLESVTVKAGEIQDDINLELR